MFSVILKGESMTTEPLDSDEESRLDLGPSSSEEEFYSSSFSRGSRTSCVPEYSNDAGLGRCPRQDFFLGVLIVQLVGVLEDALRVLKTEEALAYFMKTLRLVHRHASGPDAWNKAERQRYSPGLDLF